MSFTNLKGERNSSDKQNSVGIETNRNPNMQGQVTKMDIVGYLSQTVPISAGSENRREVWRCPNESQNPTGQFRTLFIKYYD